MYVGGGIALLVFGGILAFGVSDRVDGLDLTMIGYVCMAGGVLAIVLSLVMDRRRGGTAQAEYVERHDHDGSLPPSRSQSQYVERRYSGEELPPR